jgi:spermidine/putrescine transport system permease protein
MIKAKGIINSALLALGLIDQPLSFIHQFGCLNWSRLQPPFTILPIMTNVIRLIIAWSMLHLIWANSFTTFRRVIIPLTMPGIIAGCILIFLPAMTIPDILAAQNPCC